MTSNRKFTRAELREIILTEQGSVSRQLVADTARTFLSRALRVFTLNCPHVQRRNVLEVSEYYLIVQKLCSQIHYKYSSYAILSDPLRLPRLKEPAKNCLIWISDHAGEQAQAHAVELMENTDYAVEEVMHDITAYRHDPDLPRDLYFFLLR